MSGSDPTLWPIEPHTRVKHELLHRYLQAWYPILASPSRQLLFVDGFAGPGVYLGGEPGSPVVALRALVEHDRFETMSASTRGFHFLFVEERPDRVERLKAEIGQLSIPPGVDVEIKPGTFEDEFSVFLRRLNDEFKNAAAMVFIDPFGYTGFPMHQIRQLASHQRTEVLVNFATSSMDRWGLRRPEMAGEMDRQFGSDRWQPILSIGSVKKREEGLVGLYQSELAAAGRRGLSFRMVNRQNQTQYYLIYATGHPRGMREFKRAAAAVSPDGRFEFTDLHRPDQASFSGWVTQEVAVANLSAGVHDTFRGGRVTIQELERFTDWHPSALARDLRPALLQLEQADPPGVVEVEMPRGRTRRPDTFPKGCFVHFAP